MRSVHPGKKSYWYRRLAPRRASGLRGSCGGKESEETSVASGHIAGVLREISASDSVVYVVGISTWGSKGQRFPEPEVQWFEPTGSSTGGGRGSRQDGWGAGLGPVSSRGWIGRGGSRVSPVCAGQPLATSVPVDSEA